MRLIDPESGTSKPIALQVVPTVATFTPESVKPGDRLLIDGTGFGPDARVAFPGLENPVSPADLTATVYHALGIDPATPIADLLGRVQTVTDGKPLRALWG